MLAEVLTEDLVKPGLQARTKNDVIVSMLDVLYKTGKVRDRDAALQALMDNEARMSTGMEHGIAIPHAKTEAVDELLACVAVTRKKIDFESLDRKPARIFIMTLSPKGSTGPHIRFLAEVSQLLKDEKKRKQVLAARSASDLLSALLEPSKTE
ncbi:MAG: PTS sugar transporter subunit IIA [Spirochaetales bacterium]